MRPPLSETKGNEKHQLRIIFEDDLIPETEAIIISDFSNWQPLFDLYLVAEELIVTIEVPGVEVRDFSICIGKFYMTIEGIRKSPAMLHKNNCIFHNLEIPYGRFHRRIDFPVPVELRRYKYKLENGIFTIRFPIIKERIIPIEEE